MFGFNWIDAIIVVLLVLAVVEGVRMGVVTQLFVIVGFFAVLFLAGWLFPRLLPIHDQTLKTVINAILILLAATYAGMRSFDLGQKVHWSFRLGKNVNKRALKAVETALGSVTGIAAGLVLVWLLGVAIGRLPFEGFSNSVHDSRIVQQLTQRMPPVPAVFALYDKYTNPNAEPFVYVQPRSQTSFNYSATDFKLAQEKASNSVVRITSFGCGGILTGTGFVVGQGLVATNAHVIAGASRPIVKHNGRSYETVPVVFNPTLDMAILYAKDLHAPALKLMQENAKLDSTVAIFGYPGGNYRVAPGMLRDTLAVPAASIYDQGNAGRGIYVVQATVDYGSSGSPVVLPNGQAAGMVFSKSLDMPDTAYALTSPHLLTGLHQAEASKRRVNTGACMAE